MFELVSSSVSQIEQRPRGFARHLVSQYRNFEEKNGLFLPTLFFSLPTLFYLLLLESWVYRFTAACSRFRGSSAAAPPAPTTFREAGRSFLAEAKKVCSEIFSEAESHVLGEVDILCQEVEALNTQVMSTVSDLVTKIKVLQSKNDSAVAPNAQAVAAEDKRITEISDLRAELSSLMETQAGMAQGMGLQFLRAAEHLSRLERAKVKQKVQRLLSEDKPAGKSSFKKTSWKNSKKSKRSKRDDGSSETGPSEISSNEESKSEDEVANDRSSENEDNSEFDKDLRSKLLRHKSHHQGSMGVKFKKLGRKHPNLKKLRSTGSLYDKVLSYPLYRRRNKSQALDQKDGGGSRLHPKDADTPKRTFIQRPGPQL